MKSKFVYQLKVSLNLLIHDFIQKYLLYKKQKIKRDNHFEAVVEVIENSLSERQISRIKIINQNETYDLWEQIFLRYIDNRYWLFSYKSKTLDKVMQFLKKYKFLLDSQLDNSRVRDIFMKSLMDCISVGSGIFFSAHDFHFVEFPRPGVRHRSHIRERLFRLWKVFRKDFRKVCEWIGERYPTIPGIEIRYIGSAKNKDQWETCPLEKQLLISYSYAFRKLLKAKKINLETFKEEFTRKCKWYFESLTQCSPIFVNKYKEKVFQALSSSLGMDVDRSYFVDLSFLRDPEDDKYKQKYDLSEFIVSLFSQEQLELFELRTAQGDIWSFQEQIKDRYYSKYPSFVCIEEIKENIKKKVEDYQLLLNEESVEVIRDVLLDEIERECFVSQNTYLWNQEMEKNLKEGNWNCLNQVAKAIDFLISMMPFNAVKQLSIKVDKRIFSLREQLMCRWSKAWFGCSLQSFREYLSQLHILTSYNFESWRNKKNVSRTDLQTFLEEIDMFFLYPQKWRIVKKLMFRLDNGRSIGYANIERIKIAQAEDVISRFEFKKAIRLGVILAIFIILKFCL